MFQPFVKKVRMSEKWFWLPDWASDFSLGKDELTEVSPSASHNFVSYELMVDSLKNLFGLRGLSKADVVVGSGLGAFALLMNGEKNFQTKIDFVVALCKFLGGHQGMNRRKFTFYVKTNTIIYGTWFKFLCKSIGKGIWRMAKRLAGKCKKINSEKLSKGLLFLANNKLTKPLNDNNIEVIYGRMDKAISPEQTLKLKTFLPNVVLKERSKAGHWSPLFFTLKMTS